MDNIKLFFETANERHRIYVLKELGAPKPWTSWGPFQDSFFCNVFRDVDKTSKWIIEHLITKYWDHPQLWKSIIMCRMLSRIETLEQLEFNNCLIGDYKKAYDILRTLRDAGHSIFTGAFIINSAVGEGVWMDKINYLFTTLNYFTTLEVEGLDDDTISFEDYLQYETSMYETWKVFKDAPGIANFMAYQYTCDLTYSRYLQENIDGMEWTKLGLGAVRGMNRLLRGEPSKVKIRNEVRQVKFILNNWREWTNKNLGKEINKTLDVFRNMGMEVNEYIVRELYTPFNRLKMQDVQHWLCEFDKYCRGGSSKRKYNGRG